MSRIIVSLFILVALSISIAGQAQQRARINSNMVEAKDYLVLERVRLLDSMGFDRPVEAMSILVPRGWKTEGGVLQVRLEPAQRFEHSSNNSLFDPAVEFQQNWTRMQKRPA